MSKEMFLGVLREHLKVLEDQEQQDILQEYAQHIDIKMQNGLSEEEAIRDFGPVKELAAEILEAYHVKPEFGEPFEETRQKRGIVKSAGAAASEGGREDRKIFREALERFSLFRFLDSAAFLEYFLHRLFGSVWTLWSSGAVWVWSGRDTLFSGISVERDRIDLSGRNPLRRSGVPGLYKRSEKKGGSKR